MNNTAKIALLAAGALLGGAAGVLLAPGKGSETFQKIAGKNGRLSRALRKVVKEGKEQLSGLQEREPESTN